MNDNKGCDCMGEVCELKHDNPCISCGEMNDYVLCINCDNDFRDKHPYIPARMIYAIERLVAPWHERKETS